MNIVYAVKIFGALLIVLGMLRIVAGRGLKQVMAPQDWKGAWPVVIGTLFVSCFSVTQPLFFVAYTIWAIFAPRFFGKGGQGRLPAYVLLACISPQFSMELENVAGLRDVMRLDTFRIIELVILVPAAVALVARRERSPWPWWLVVSDVATGIYALYWIMQLFGHFSMTALSREGLQVLLDTVLPYYVISRGCVQAEMRQRVLSVLLFGAAYQGLVAIAEGLSRHVLYGQLQYLYGTRWNLLGAMTRGDWVRAQAAFSGPLVMAMLALFAIGVWFALRPVAKSRAYAVVGLVLLGGLLATFSRGPLLALGILVAGLTCLRFLSARRFLLLSLVVVVAGAIAWSAGLGDSLVEAINATSADKQADFNVVYRQELLKTSVALIQQSPWFGVPNYLDQMTNLKQGDGIVDLVNTYLIVTLNVGVVGLALFIVPFLVVLGGLAARQPKEAGALRRERLVWIPLTLAVMAAVFTVSPVSIIRSLLVWTVAIALASLQDGLTARRRDPLEMATIVPLEA
jgi:O-antigen ligase